MEAAAHARSDALVSDRLISSIPAEGLRAPALDERLQPARDAEARAPRRSELTWLRACLCIDAMMLGAAAATAELGASRAGVPHMPDAWLLLSLVLVGGLLAVRGIYGPRLSLRVLDDARSILFATTVAAMAVVSLRAVTSVEPALGQQSLRLWAFATVYLVGGRFVLSWSETAARRRGETLRPTLIVGAGQVGRLAAKRMLAHPELGLRPVGFLDKDARSADGPDGLPPVLGASWDLERVVREHGVEQVVVTFSKAPHDVLLRLARRCDELGVATAFVPRLFDRMSERVKVDHVVGLPLLTVDLADPHGWQFTVKHTFDRALAGLLLVLLAPVLLVVSLGVVRSLGKPILFRQTRVGRDGRRFDMLKFRTMRQAREGEPAAGSFELPPDTAPGGIEGIDLRSRFGDLLRRTSLDELPQLVNVLRGEMSLVGPRPERPEFVDLFEEAVPRYTDRHRVKAGITGWAQVNGMRGKTSISERAELDNYYVQNWSLWLDVKILLMTFAAVVVAFRTVE